MKEDSRVTEVNYEQYHQKASIKKNKTTLKGGKGT